MLAIIKDISIYGIGDLLSRGINFLAIILYTHFLSQ
jgi:O-antigen/teichoic acid export membrane protein